MSSLPDARYDELAEALRAARPRAGADLRARVAALGEVDAVERKPARPSGRRRWRLSWRPALVLAPIVVAGVAVGIALDAGSRGSSADEATSAGAGWTIGGEKVSPGAGLVTGARRDAGAVDAESTRRGRAPAGRTAIPPSGRRLQEYRAELRVRVTSLDDLSETTTRAMRIARSLGGFVVGASYAAPGDGDGDSRLTVRVPVDKVSAAVMRFADLGTVVGQQVAIQDLQTSFNRQSDRIEALRGTIAELERELRRTDLDVEARIRLQTRLATARGRLESARATRSSIERRGRLATVALTLTTREGAELQPPSPPGRFEQTLRDALGVLATIVTWAVAGLIVAGPFLLLALAGVALERRRRRRADDRLLEQPS